MSEQKLQGNVPSSQTADELKREDVTSINIDHIVEPIKSQNFEGTVHVLCGANTAEMPVVGNTVEEVRASVAELMNIKEDADAYVNGEIVDPQQHVLQNDETLEFIKPSGQKG